MTLRLAATCLMLFLLPADVIRGQADAIRVPNGPALTISPKSIAFPQTAVGAQSAPLSITLTNPSDAPMQVQEILVSGIDFAETNDCGKELAAGAKCSIQVTFKPAITGDRIGSLEITGFGGIPEFVPLSGTGIS